MNTAQLNFSAFSTFFSQTQRKWVSPEGVNQVLGGDICTVSDGEPLKGGSKDVFAIHPSGCTSFVVKRLERDGQAAANELLARLLLKHIIGDEKLYIPPAIVIADTKSPDFTLVTEYFQGNRPNDYYGRDISPKDLACLFSTLMFLPLADLHMSSILVEPVSPYKAALFDLESLDFSTSNLNSSSVSVDTLFLLLSYAGAGKLGGLESSLESIGNTWLELVQDDKFFDELTRDMVTTLDFTPQGPLGEYLPDIVDIINCLRERAKAYSKFDFKPWNAAESVSNANSQVDGIPELSNVDKLPIELLAINEYDKAIVEIFKIIRSIGELPSDPTSDNNFKNITRFFHTMQGVSNFTKPNEKISPFSEESTKFMFLSKGKDGYSNLTVQNLKEKFNAFIDLYITAREELVKLSGTSVPYPLDIQQYKV